MGDLGNIVVSTTNGTPVLLRQVATLATLPLLRHGAVMKDGRGETVSGMVIILRGENGRKIINEIKAKIADLKLPGGAKIIPFYDQSDVIDATIHTVKKNLIEAAVLVIVVLLIFLGDWRAALVVAATIPLALLFAFLGMETFGISANLMSLGAIDFGTIVDGSVVMVENCMHRLEREKGDKPLLDVVRDASHEVARPIVFGVLIIIAVYLPVLTLQSLEGRMFRPMAVTVVSALTGSLLLALFAVPTLCTIALKRQASKRKSNEDEHKSNPSTELSFRPERNPQNLSSRPERSAVEGPASPTPAANEHPEKKPWFDRLRTHYVNSLLRRRTPPPPHRHRGHRPHRRRSRLAQVHRHRVHAHPRRGLYGHHLQAPPRHRSL